MRALVAPDKFKGTHSAGEVADAIATGLGGDVDRCPVADGGEGTIDALLAAHGGERLSARVDDAQGRTIDASLALLADGRTAVVEVAEAIGLWRIPESRRDAVAANSAGAGQLIAAAIDRGAETVLVACGGSASTDGGAAALERFDPSRARLVVLCDTGEPFERAPATFAPQKGAGPEDVIKLSERLDRVADALPRDPRGRSMTGAAGGLSGALWAHGAELVPGAPHVLDAVGFDARLRDATFVVTGEGRLDRSSMSGKAPFEVATRARQAGVPCHAIVGRCELDRFDLRILDLASVTEASTLAGVEAAAQAITEPSG